MWQVIFLELSDGSYLAFCPYTKIWSRGNNISDAALNWNLKVNATERSELTISDHIDCSIKIYCDYGGDCDYFTFEKPDIFTIEVSISKEICPKIIDTNDTLAMDFKFRCTHLLQI